MFRVLAVIVPVAFLSGCGSLSSGDDRFSSILEGLDASGKPVPQNGGLASRRLFGSGREAPFKGVTDEGTGQFISHRAPAISVETRASGELGYRLNLVDAPIAAAAKNVLGDILGLNYVVDPRVQGSLTLQTSAPVSRDALIDIFGCSRNGRIPNVRGSMPIHDHLAQKAGNSSRNVRFWRQFVRYRKNRLFTKAGLRWLFSFLHKSNHARHFMAWRSQA